MEKIQTFKAHTGRIWHLDWSPDGNLLSTCGADKSIMVYKFENNQWVHVDRLDGTHTKSVRKIK